MSREAQAKKKAAAARVLRVTILLFVVLIALLVYLGFTGHVEYASVATNSEHSQLSLSLQKVSQSRLAARKRRKQVMEREKLAEEKQRFQQELREVNIVDGAAHEDDDLREQAMMKKLADEELGEQDAERLPQNDLNPADMGDEGAQELKRVWKRHREEMAKHADQEMGDDFVEPRLGDHGAHDWDNVEDLPGGDEHVADGIDERLESLRKSKERREERLQAAKERSVEKSKNGKDDEPDEDRQRDANDANPPDMLGHEANDNDFPLLPPTGMPSFNEVGGQGAGSEGDAVFSTNPACKIDIAELNSWVPRHPVQTAMGREFDMCSVKQSDPATFQHPAGNDNRAEWYFVQQPSSLNDALSEAFGELDAARREKCLGNKMLQSIVDDRTFKFAFVQDPWERFVHTYVTVSLPHEGRVQQELKDEQLLNERLFGAIGELSKDVDGRGIDRQYLPQIFYLSDYEGKLLDFDFIGRVEHLDKDFQQVISIITDDSVEDTLHAPKARPLQENLFRDLLEKQVRKNTKARNLVLKHYRADALCFYGDQYDAEELV